MRYEIKIPVSDLDISAIRTIIKLHPSNFKETYYKRKINSIYFDDYDRNSYFDNVEGKSERRKIRIRWYGEGTEVIEPVLEEKNKCGSVGYKRLFALDKVQYSDVMNISNLKNLLIDNSKSDFEYYGTINLEAVIYISYYRTYFISFNKKFRLTLDEKIQFKNIGGDNNFFKGYSGSIIEVKFELENFDESSDIISYFPFRMDKISKYATGTLYSKR